MRRVRTSAQDSVLLTGATAGVGLELAREFARHGHPLIMVAPDAMELVNIAQRFHHEHGVMVLPIPADLQRPGTAADIFAQLQADDVNVGILVNHAAVSAHGRFDELPLEKEVEMLGLNIGAMVRLTKLLLPGMIARERGKVLNTAAAPAFTPAPLRAMSRAAATFVRSLSESLAMELADTGVTVTALCLGAAESDDEADPAAAPGARHHSLSGKGSQGAAQAAYEALMGGVRVVEPEVPKDSSRSPFRRASAEGVLGSGV